MKQCSQKKQSTSVTGQEFKKKLNLRAFHLLRRYCSLNLKISNPRLKQEQKLQLYRNKQCNKQ